MKATALSVATLLRAQERLEDSLGQMTVAEANTMPHPLIKSVTWLMWHTARELDLQVSELKGSPSLWLSAGWSERFALPLPDDTEDWHHTPEEAAKVTVADKALLSEYLAASITLTRDYLLELDEATLHDVVDDSWAEPVTREVRLVSVIDDAVMHSGQAVYTRRLVINKQV